MKKRTFSQPPGTVTCVTSESAEEIAIAASASCLADERGEALMDVEKDRDYWTIVYDCGCLYEVGTPYRVRLVREHLSVYGFSSNLENPVAESLRVLRRELGSYIFETEEAAWLAFARSSASPVGYLRQMRDEVESRVRDFRRRARLDEVPEYARELLFAEVEAGEQLLAQINVTGEERR